MRIRKRISAFALAALAAVGAVGVATVIASEDKAVNTAAFQAPY